MRRCVSSGNHGAVIPRFAPQYLPERVIAALGLVTRTWHGATDGWKLANSCYRPTSTIQPVPDYRGGVSYSKGFGHLLTAVLRPYAKTNDDAPMCAASRTIRRFIPESHRLHAAPGGDCLRWPAPATLLELQRDHDVKRLIGRTISRAAPACASASGPSSPVFSKGKYPETGNPRAHFSGRTDRVGMRFPLKAVDVWRCVHRCRLPRFFSRYRDDPGGWSELLSSMADEETGGGASVIVAPHGTDSLRRMVGGSEH